MQTDADMPTGSSDSESGSFEERVRNLAYELWQKEGEPEGHHDEFWLRAEQRIRAGDTTEQPEPEHQPLDAHDVAMTESFPASDPPSTTGVASTISHSRHDLPGEEVEDEAAD